MPRDLFGDVTRPSISIGNRKWYTVPVSLISHALIIGMVVIVPILAAPMMPGVLDNSSLTRFIDIVPPKLPPPPAIRKTELQPTENPNAAPTVAPTDIAPEKPLDLDWQNSHTSGTDGTILGGVDNGLPPPPAVVTPPPVSQGPIRVGHMIRTPTKTKSVQPVYPRMAQEARIEGIVIIEATISEAGQVMNAKLLRSVPLLDQAAIDAVRQWEFTPSLLNGVPVPVIMTVTVTFTLSR
ncbi:MAG: energy transducer TonB [Cyanobacteria bacterium]|nr:energy transducer TonB [Cyanobacteriota bacterium]